MTTPNLEAVKIPKFFLDKAIQFINDPDLLSVDYISREATVAALQSHIEAQPVDQKEAMDALDRIKSWIDFEPNAPVIYDALDKISAFIQAKQPAPVDVESMQTRLKAYEDYAKKIGAFIPCATGGTFENDPPDAVFCIVLNTISTGIIVPKGE